MKKIVAIFLTLSFLSGQVYAGDIVASSNNKLAASLATDEDINPPRSDRIKEEGAEKSEPGAIGNGTPLVKLSQNNLPHRLILQKEEFRKIALKLHDAIAQAIDIGLANLAKVPPGQQSRAIEAITNLTNLYNNLEREAYLFNAVVEGPEDYLLGFNRKNECGLSIELINYLYGISPMRLAQYIYHECVPELGMVTERDDHRSVYRDIQTAIFGVDEVKALKDNLRLFIDMRIAARTTQKKAEVSEAIDERAGFPLLGGYKAEDVKVLIIGLGGFIRTELVSMIDQLNVSGEYNGKVVMVHPRSTEIATVLKEQGGIYQTITKYPDGREEVKAVRCVAGVGTLIDKQTGFSARDGETDRAAFMRYAALDLDMIGIGVTEAGLAKDSPTMKDLMDFLYQYFNKHGPRATISIINTDNFANNGSRIRDSVLYQAEKNGDESEFIRWLRDNVTFHNTMVDRIVGSPDKKEDPYKPPVAEPVPPIRLSILDTERALRVPLWKIGPAVKLRTSEEDFKKDNQWKLRILNALHTAQVYVAALTGMTYVWESMSDPTIYDYISRIMDNDIVPTINRNLPVAGSDAASFAKGCMERFKNPYIPLKTRWVAQGAVDKIGLRFAPTIKDMSEMTENVTPEMAFAVACVLRYITPTGTTMVDDGRGGQKEVYVGRNDPNTGQDKEYIFEEGNKAVPDALMNMFGKSWTEVAEKIYSLLSNESLWKGVNLAKYASFRHNVTDMYHRMLNGESAMQVLQTLPAIYTSEGPRYRMERWKQENFEHADLMRNPPPVWQDDRPTTNFFDDSRSKLDKANSQTAAFRIYEDKESSIPLSLFEPLPNSLEASHLSPLGDFPYFERDNYADQQAYEEAVRFLFLPNGIVPRQFAFNLEQYPWLNGMELNFISMFLYECRKNDIINMAAEIRTKKDNHSCLLIKFTNNPKLYILDRTAGRFANIPEELMLGWYAPLYDGTNAAECPHFDKYRAIYEAYMPKNFVLNAETIYYKSGVSANTVQEGSSDPVAIAKNQISKDLPRRAEMLKNVLNRISASDPSELFFMGIETVTNEAQARDIVEMYKIIDDIKSMTGPDGKKLFPNLVVSRREASNLVEEISRLRTEGDGAGRKLKNLDHVFIGARWSSVNSAKYKDITGEGKAWVSAIEDSKEDIYLPVFEAVTLSMMAYLNADLEAIKHFYDAISDNPANPDELVGMLRNRMIYVLPKSTAFNGQQRRELYELAHQIYIAA